MYITAASTISHQPTFKNAGFSKLIEPLKQDSELISPNFKDYIDAGLLRRMSKILRISVTAAKDCLQQAEIDQPGAIIVGTGLGCLQDTEKFLHNFLTIEGLLPPTSFIQSTHNTIAGQISLSIGNHGYNMTHTQNTLSFEHALIDTGLLLGEGNDNIIVGAADEYIEILSTIGEHLKLKPQINLTSGASFFIVSKEQSGKSIAKIKDIETIGLVQNIDEAVSNFLVNNDLKKSAIDLVLYSKSGDLKGSEQDSDVLKDFDADSELVNYTELIGIYPSNSSFALHYALDRIQTENSIKKVLIINGLNKINLGLTLIESLEA
ncbi:beta-ketoacyl synthase chain length factor [Dyadobacter subterraneus]|uniref:Beta-ketoacyl synthase chain length factor n=1 Tax=Dyadobacter subterraneus TaxID=2773304 RepID=A0ABR9WF06_9BACT|nr:beta-ketoacyl synthase chain length factor [Dyadobacter subterraneus]MBE9464075.1 beta-ketoacyl synthase chain length factor [Dyadobacter subterraneus]